MVWSKWKTAAATAVLASGGLTCVSLVYSQQSTPRPAASVGSNDVVMINEAGKPPQRCEVVKSWRQPNGKLSYEVRNLTTGETSTLTDVANPLPAAAAAQAAPVDGWVATKPGVNPMLSADSHSGVSTPTSEFRNIDEAGKPPLKCRVVAEWRTSDGHKAAQLQAVESGEILTIVEIDSTGGAGSGKMTARLYHWGRSTTPPPGVPVPPSQTMAAPMMVAQPAPIPAPLDKTVIQSPGTKIITADAQKPSLGERLKGAFGGIFSSNTTTQPVQSTNNFGAPAVKAPFPKTSDFAKAPDAPRVNDVARPIDTANTPDAASTYNLLNAALPPKPTDVARTAVPVSSAATTKANDSPKPPDAPKALDLVPLKEAAKPANLVAPPPDYKTQWAPIDVKAPGFAKPSADSTLPPGVPPSIPTAQQKAPAIPPAPTPAQLIGGNNPPSLPPAPIPAQPAIGSATPLPPTPSAVGKTTSAPALPPVPTPVSPLSGNVSPSMPPLPGSLNTSARKSDPLISPETFSPARVDPNGQVFKDASKQPVIVPPMQPVASMPPVPSLPGVAQATDAPRVPLGAASVVAAANGGDPRYLPTPIVTVPQARPPMPPAAPTFQAPQAPDPTAYVNAFTPAMPPEAMRQAQMPMMPQPYTMAQGNPAMGQGYGPMPMVYSGPMPPNPGGAQGYPMPMMPQQGYPVPMMPQAYPMPIMPQAYQMPAMPVQQPMGYANPAMDRPGLPLPGAMTVPQCINTLQSSIFPSQRETAIYQLCGCDWKANPLVVQVLITTAKEDPAAMVRAAAVGSLARMGVVTEATLATYNQLKADTDPRVRREAEQALAGTAPVSNVHPASGMAK